MAKYKRSYSFEIITEAGKLDVSGCNSFAILNAGNTLVTLDTIIPLEPLDSFRGGEAHPDIEEAHVFDVEFAIGPDVPPADFITPVGGVFGTAYQSSNANGVRDSRCILIKTHIV